jgi:hypothetical protein
MSSLFNYSLLSAITIPTTNWQNTLLALSPVPILLTAVFTILFRTIARDYRAFVSLGPGGTPSNPAGYLRIKFLSLFALQDPYKPVPVPLHFKQQSGHLSSGTKLAARSGERPMVRGIAPHRQTNQKAPAEAFALLRTAIVELAAANASFLVQKTSCLEKHGPGLFVRVPLHCTPHCNGEVCHAHPSDGSMHLTLHPADAAIVLAAGWGERHPLGSGGWLRRFVPAGFIMVYAPRTADEVEQAMRIVRAAVWWVGGLNIEQREAGAAVMDGAVKEKECGNSSWLASCPDSKTVLMP